MLLSIVMPAYNEEKSLEEIVRKVMDIQLPENIDRELIIIDDGSKDATWNILQKLREEYKGIKVFKNEKNLGKSQTVRRGILETSGDVVIIQDADLEYDPTQISGLLKVMQEKNLDVVYGNRFGKKNQVIYWQNYFGNKCLSTISNIFTYPRIHVWIPDMEVCYKMARGDIFREIGETITSKSMFGLEPEITAKLSKYKRNGKHLRFGIIPIDYAPRTVAEGKKMKALKDGMKTLKEIFAYNFF